MKTTAIQNGVLRDCSPRECAVLFVYIFSPLGYSNPKRPESVNFRCLPLTILTLHESWNQTHVCNLERVFLLSQIQFRFIF